MKITILTSRGLPGNYASNLLISRLPQHQFSLFMSNTGGKSITKASALERLTFYDHTMPNELLGPQFDNVPARHGNCLFYSQMHHKLCEPWQVLNKEINRPQGVDAVRKTQPDLIVSLRYGEILKGEVLTVPKHGVIGLHSGLLPAYRGVMSTFWSMKNGEDAVGSTVFSLEDGKIDTGNVIATAPVPIEPDKSYWWHVMQLLDEGVQALADTVEKLDRGLAMPQITQHGAANYYGFPQDNDVADFHAKGLSLVNELEVSDFLKTHYLG